MVNSRTFTYVVTDQDSVRAITRSPEFSVYKPPVMASARLMEVCEWFAMEMLREDLRADECSLGAWQHISHCGPIPIGARLTIVVECDSRRGSYSEWQVAVHDDHEEVCRARLGFVVVNQDEFTRTKVFSKVTPSGTTTTVLVPDHAG
ncbi:MAG TPA: hotdog domain-containing protein [Amycolatopsis sp.]|uniref:thioesterase family protein n=1 Tax=Amycolatopsis sp. TaxID=37632 RepID=UPI002B4A1701|nr:hotdog domain-containing protein [Amycolatopsis sp.]HKS49357.1 hotdog domain-containing protein [Amycolatopsis sp.]